VLGCETLVRRFNSGDFVVIFPVYALREDYTDGAIQMIKCRLVFAIKEEGNNMKCLVPYGGSDWGGRCSA